MRRNYEKGQRAKKFMVYFIAFIMISSAFGVIFFGFGGNSASSVQYKEFEFFNRQNFWSTTINDREALFTYFPADVENINAEQNAINKLKNVIEIDITSDFNDTYAEQIALAQYQMGITLNNFNAFVRAGFTAKNNYNQPLITCNISTSFVPVIYFKSSNETKIYLQNDCIVAEAEKINDIIRIKDRIVYGIFGIIK